jgi:hypothetical protein
MHIPNKVPGRPNDQTSNFENRSEE